MTVAQRVAESRKCGGEDDSFWHGFAVIPKSGQFIIVPTTDPQFCSNEKYNGSSFGVNGFCTGAANNLIWAFSYSEGERAALPNSVLHYPLMTDEHILTSIAEGRQIGARSIYYRYLMYFPYVEGRPHSGYREGSTKYFVYDNADGKYHYDPTIPEPPWLMIFATPYNYDMCPFDFTVSGDTEEAWNDADIVTGCDISSGDYSHLQPYYKTLAQCGFKELRVYEDFATDSEARAVDHTNTEYHNYAINGDNVQTALDARAGRNSTDSIKGAHHYGSGRFTLEYFGLRSYPDTFLTRHYCHDSNGYYYWFDWRHWWVLGFRCYGLVGAVPFYEAHEVRFRPKSTSNWETYTGDYNTVLPKDIYSSNQSKNVEYQVYESPSVDIDYLHSLETEEEVNEYLDSLGGRMSTHTYKEYLYKFTDKTQAPSQWSGLEGGTGDEGSGTGFIGKCVTEARLYSYAPPLGGYFPFGEVDGTGSGMSGFSNPGTGYRSRFPIAKCRVSKLPSDVKVYLPLPRGQFYPPGFEGFHLYKLTSVKDDSSFTWSDFEDLKMMPRNADQSTMIDYYDVPPFTDTIDEYVLYNSNDNRDGYLVFWEPEHVLGTQVEGTSLPSEYFPYGDELLAICLSDSAHIFRAGTTPATTHTYTSGLYVQGYGITNIVTHGDVSLPVGWIAKFPGGYHTNAQGSRVYFGSSVEVIERDVSAFELPSVWILQSGILGHLQTTYRTGICRESIVNRTARSYYQLFHGRNIKSHRTGFRRLHKTGVGDILIPQINEGTPQYVFGNLPDEIFDVADVYYYPMAYITGYLRYNPELGGFQINS